MAAPPETAEAPPPPEAAGEEAKERVEMCLFDESVDGFSRTVRAISELADREPEQDFPEAEVERLSSSITFLREWRHFCYEPRGVSFTNDSDSASSRDGMHNITLPQFSSASVPQASYSLIITPQEDLRDNTASFDFVLFAGGNVWALDWCPRLCYKPGSSINCEYLAVSTHPPGSSYHKLGMPLTGRGIIQVWCLLAPVEDARSCRPTVACNNSGRRGRPRKTPCSDQREPVPKGPKGRPRKRPHSDQLEPVPKRPRGRPRKYPLPVPKPEESSQNCESLDIVPFDPLASTAIPDDLPLANVVPTVKSVDSTPRRGRGRPRKNPINKLTGSSGTVSKEDVCTALSPAAAICTEPKRPRGRPRKYPILINDKDVCTEPKRPQGRPRKYPIPINNKSVSGAAVELGKETTCQPVSFGCSLDHTSCTEFNSNLSIVADDATLPIVDNLTGSSGTVVKENKCIEPSPITAIRNQPKRTRVRPQRYSDAETELRKDTSGQPALFGCSLYHTAGTESNSNLSIVAVDGPSPFTSSSTVTCENNSKDQSIRGQDNKLISDVTCPLMSGVESQSTCSREIIQNDHVVSVENALPSAQNIGSVSELCSASLLNCENGVHKGALSDDSVPHIHISPKSSNKRESSGRSGRGRLIKTPLSAGTSSVASGASLPKTSSELISSADNLTSLERCDGRFIASGLGSSGCDTEKYIDHSGAVSFDTASPAHGLYNANCKEESSTKRGRGRPRKKHVSTEQSHFTDFNGKEQKTQTTPNSSGPVVSVENCMKGPCPRKSVGQSQRIPASNESSNTSVGSEAMPHEAGLSQFKNGTVGCKGVKVNESNTANFTSHCNENVQAKQVVPSFKNSDSVIDETEAIEHIPLKESRENDNIFSCVENSNSSPIPKDIALPRIIFCLAHNGKVAWDIKWKPPLLSQPEQKLRLGFLAVLLGNGSLEVWEVPSPCMIQKIYSSSKVEGSDPHFLKLQPVFRCVKVKCGNRQSIPLTVDWSPSPPHDMILAGCHDGTVALWNFSMNLSLQDSKPFMCVTADSVPIRALSWAPYISEENTNTFVTAGEDGLKFWDLRDPYRPLWELATSPRAVLSLHWLKDGRGIVISMEDGTLKFLSLPRIANDAPATGRPFAGTKTQGVATYQLSEYLIWSIHASEHTGFAAYCGADGTAVHFQLTSKFWEACPGRNHASYFLSGSLSEDGENLKIGSRLPTCPLQNVPVVTKKGSKPCQTVVQALPTSDVAGQLTCQLNSPTRNIDTVNPQLDDDRHSEEQGAGAVNQELGNGKYGHSEEQGMDVVNLELGNDQDERSEEQGAGAIVLAGTTEEENYGTLNSVVPPKSVALHQVRWNTNKGSERWLCYGGAAGIIRCQRI
ncbi:hypothetical protein U9M48_017085 [Paspalum notatum var. saurae]|uniref:Transducin/WD40 repeat-like superfamily protein n=1 Tax=Paspalum notatum var. saurae TaxID=547442 RepID=A0AAQ3WN86_PASNO